MTAKLILTLDGAIVREYPLRKDSVSIGRKHGNDVQLNDMTVSGRHALVTTVAGNTYVDDLGSTNGTLLNGKRVTKALLKHGDILQVGNHQFTFFEQEEAKYEPTMFIKAEIAETQVIPQENRVGDDVNMDVRGQRLAGVKILNGPMSNTVLELRKPFNTIGYKGIKMAVVTRNNVGYTISRLQGMKTRRASDVPLLNGTPIPTLSQPLKEHDVVEIAGFQMEFFYIT